MPSSWQQSLVNLCDVIESYCISLNFVIRTTFALHQGVLESKTNVGTHNGSVAFKVFYQGNHSLRPRSTVLVIHGLSPSGYDDHRLVDLSRTLAACGYLVVFPDLETFRRCELDHHSRILVSQIVDLVTEREDLCPDGVLDVVSACISAGLCMVAAVNDHRIRSVLSFGAPADAQRVWNHLKHSNHPDAVYGVNAILLNYWEPENEELCQLLLASLADDHYRTVGSHEGHFASVLSRVNAENRIKYKRIKEDFRFRSAVFQQISTSKEFTSGFGAVSPLLYTEKIMCQRIILVHGAYDGIIPSEESRSLYQKFKDTQVETSLCITTLLNHGNKSSLGLNAIFEGLTLLGSFATFFRRYRKP